MHIPDGYISPVIAVGMGVVTVPTWRVATRKVQDVLSNRTIPLLAIFSAMSFTIMMFNVPVPGGTTAHGVGGTLIAIVLGPWAAVIGVSVGADHPGAVLRRRRRPRHLRQLLQHGVVLPFVGYGLYRLLAGRSELLSSRRAWAGGIAAYVAITARRCWSASSSASSRSCSPRTGTPLYSPYGLSEAVPAMLARARVRRLGGRGRHHLPRDRLPAEAPPGVPDPAADRVRDDGCAEGQVSASAAVAAGERGDRRGRRAARGRRARRWAAATPAALFGADWSSVDWAAVASMLLVVGVIFVDPRPAGLARSCRGASSGVGTAFTAVAVLAPLGLIAPGFAYGEGCADDVAGGLRVRARRACATCRRCSARRSAATTCRCRSSATPTPRCGTRRSATRSPGSSASCCAAARSTA